MTGKSSLYRYTLMLTVGLSAVVLLTLSWPRLRASFNYLPVDTAISNYWKTRQIDNAQLDGLIRKAEESIAIHDHYRYQAGLSELKILSGQDMSRSLWQRRQALEDSISAAEKVVQRAPAKPRVWLRIARAKEILAYPADEILPAFKMSILTGRVEPTLMLSRLELGLRQLPVMDEEATRLLRDQALLTWATQQRPMQKRIESGHLNINQLRELLAESNPDVVREMGGDGGDNWGQSKNSLNDVRSNWGQSKNSLDDVPKLQHLLRSFYSDPNYLASAIRSFYSDPNYRQVSAVGNFYSDPNYLAKASATA